MLEDCYLPVEMAVPAMFQRRRLTSFQESLFPDLLKSLTYLFVRENKYIHHMEVMRTVVINEDMEWKKKGMRCWRKP